MSSVDSAGSVPPLVHLDIRQLPEVVAVQVRQVRYKRPRRLTIRGKDEEISAAVEVVVETSGPLPIRALNPVLYVGETALTVAEGDGDRRYRFLVPKPEDLTPGAPISLGWSGSPTSRRGTRFTYQPSTQPVEER